MSATEVMLRRLASDRPDPDHAEALSLFGRFIGSWEIEMSSIRPDGTRRTFTAEWHFGWALEGRAVQDVLVTRSPEGDVVGFGTTVRTYDPSRGVWWVVWQDPVAGEFSVLLASDEGDRIVLHGEWTIGDGKRPFRWTFSNITPESFRWECHIQEDAGTWRLVEQMDARRS
jgi:hypothetical protein